MVVSAGYSIISISTETDGSLYTPVSRAAPYGMEPTVGSTLMDRILPSQPQLMNSSMRIESSSAHGELHDYAMVMADLNRKIIAAIHEFYCTIVRLPYIDADALVLPPLGGWSGVNADELRKRGKTEEVIQLLRYLPYLRNPSQYRKWMLSPDTLTISYCDGEMYGALMDELQPTPAHCIWLTAHDSRDGIDLLFDTHTGTSTIFSLQGRRAVYTCAEYEQMEKADRWMCYPTMPVADFFKLWQARWEKLVWIPVYNPRGGPATATWWYRAIPGSDEEEYILVSDEEYEATDDEDDTSGSSISGAGGEGCDTGGDDDERVSQTALSDREVSDILNDAFGEEAQRKRIQFTSEAEERTNEIASTSELESDSRTENNNMGEEQVANALYTIFQRNGWPDCFDREKCRAEIDGFQQN
ncbi:hypothetical protein O1611_g1473 [Lasiodiplodia mahajangana]|uniref:Uncharacterized protein n=1 Tax=Lasiodiplodia mahajangana TaxID=1108764 RepID=A0ACC2JXJ8_9PEZI|nr:hypothetical protein O1611_g1473 [Lasiodiplodia mahajangana]